MSRISTACGMPQALVLSSSTFWITAQGGHARKEVGEIVLADSVPECRLRRKDDGIFKPSRPRVRPFCESKTIQKAMASTLTGTVFE